MRQTSLYANHLALGAKMVPFAGWEMPVQYSGLIEEHKAVRAGAGIFDVSHMGEILVSGNRAEAFLNYHTCNNVSAIQVGRCQYNALLNDRGGLIDDIIIYRLAADLFFICVNASNREKDLLWLQRHLKDGWSTGVKVEDVSDQYGQIALQGPRAVEILEQVDGFAGVSEIKYFHFQARSVLGHEIIIARTGYTGEDGFELFVPWEYAPDYWNLILKNGKKDEVVPCGLGARDTLRLEACYPLYGHELSDEVSAVESGLSWIIKPQKGDFLAKDILVNHLEVGAPRKLVGFAIDDPGIARHQDGVLSGVGREIGFVTSGTRTPTVGRSIGMALVEREYSELQTSFEILVRGRKLRAHVVPQPFFKRTTR